MTLGGSDTHKSGDGNNGGEELHVRDVLSGSKASQLEEEEANAVENLRRVLLIYPTEGLISVCCAGVAGLVSVKTWTAEAAGRHGCDADDPGHEYDASLAWGAGTQMSRTPLSTTRPLNRRGAT